MDWRARRWLFLVELGSQLETQARAAMQVPPAQVPTEELGPLVEWLALIRTLSRVVEQEARRSSAQARVVQRLALEEERRLSARSKGGAVPAATLARLCPKHRAKAAAKSSTATSRSTAARGARTASTKSRRATKR